MCPLPDSSDANFGNARTLAGWLGDLDVNTFIQKNDKEPRRVTDAKSRAERLDILKNKFEFKWDEAPTVGHVLLIDDKASSGDTIDAVAKALKDHCPGIESVTALAFHVYVGRKVESPEVRRLEISKQDEGELEVAATL